MFQLTYLQQQHDKCGPDFLTALGLNGVILKMLSRLPQKLQINAHAAKVSNFDEFQVKRFNNRDFLRFR
ncbi:MAG: hypothetical protein JST19_21625 [Bacteroidetes bacterium]|nr:hypothetical protein [Bacteroidota bacterium]